ncbi:MAG: hypothetical protein D6730_08710 [Bacteroidetes bacterium]|nr:MAG: hypothetical protein D6730_08710 [Bacteroidota bacterium]
MTHPFSFLLLLLLIFSSKLPGYAQTSATNTAEEQVKQVVYTLFDGMRAGDSSMIRPLFAQGVILASCFEREGKSQMRSGDIENFIRAVGSPHEEVWDEKIWDLEVRVDDNMATAWMKYAFFRGEQFSHCGVNNFVLFHSDTGWKIVHLMDTRRQSPCPLPDKYAYPAGG